MKISSIFDLMFLGSDSNAVKYKGVWDANANNPVLSSNGGGGVEGDYYIVGVAGTTLIDGINDWEVNDWIVNNGTVWEKIDNSDMVLSVNGKTGNVTLVSADIPFDNSGTNLISTDVENALKEINSNLEEIRILNFTAGENLSAYVMVYRDTDGKIYTADKKFSNKSSPIGITLEAVTSGNNTNILKQGLVENSAWSWSLNNQKLYLSDNGNLTPSITTVANEFVVPCAEIISATKIYLNISEIKFQN